MKTMKTIKTMQAMKTMEPKKPMKPGAGWPRTLLTLAAAGMLHGPAAAAPADTARPLFRWWWPNALVQQGEIESELDAVARAGFGGVEIAALPHHLKVDPGRYGWGSQAWNDALRHALAEAARRHLQVDLTIGPAWPSVVPGVGPDSEAAAKQLVPGRAVIDGGRHAGPLPPPPAAGAGVRKHELVALLAYPCAAACSADDSATVDPEAAVDLTRFVRADRIEWDAPAGRWLLAAFWQRGTGQMDNMRMIEGPEAPGLTREPAYAVDHFSTAGTRAVTDYWDASLLPADIQALLRQVGASIFEDSLELHGEQYWTPALLAEFRQRRGYALTPYLPVLFTENPKPKSELPGPDGDVELPEFMRAPKHYAFRVPEDVRARDARLRTDLVRTVH
jgi:hypothetical protein